MVKECACHNEVDHLRRLWPGPDPLTSREQGSEASLEQEVETSRDY